MSEQVPEGWDNKSIGSLLVKKTIKTTQNNQHTVLSVTKDGIFPQRDYFKKQIASENNIGYKIIEKGDLVFSTMNLWMGSLDVLKTSDIGIVSPAYSTFEFNNKNCITEFMSFLMRDVGMIQKYIQHSQMGASIVRRNLDIDGLLKDSIPIPPLPEQKKIASILTSVDEVIEKTQSQIDKLQDLKKGTMNELLTKGIGHTEFKDSELGRIPKSWEVVPIGNTTKFSQGIQVDVEQHYEREDDSKVRFIRISDYTKSDETPRYVDKSLAIKGIVEKNDVVMIRYGEAGRVCRGIVGAIANNLFTIKPNHYLEKEFLFQILSSNEISNKISELAASSAMPAISFSSLQTIKLKIPPIDEQLEISDVILSIDTKIDVQKQKLHQTQSLKKSLMQDLLTGKVRVSVN